MTTRISFQSDCQ